MEGQHLSKITIPDGVIGSIKRQCRKLYCVPANRYYDIYAFMWYKFQPVFPFTDKEIQGSVWNRRG